MCRDGTLIAFRLTCVADLASKCDKVHVERIRFAFGNDLGHQFMCFLRSTIRWHKPKSFADPQNMRIHREHITTTSKSKRDKTQS